jgi:glycosyltransferase involved in cell wall biosynthesis
MGSPVTDDAGHSRRLVIATMAVGVPMGQQLFEEELAEALTPMLPDSWILQKRRVGSARSRNGPDIRLPLQLVGRFPYSLRWLAARPAYGRADLVHRMDLRLPSPVAHEVLTVHDLACLRFPDEGELPRKAAESARRATVMVTGSEFAADEIVEAFGVARPIVIPHGIDHRDDAGPVLSDEAFTDLDIGTRFVIHMGGATQRKNLEGLADAWQLISRQRPELHLVLCGPDHPRRHALFDGLPRCHLLGRVDPTTLAGLRRRAVVVVVPSLHEGFGLPALEAMAAGTPVVAARRGALPEVCGDDAVLVEPDGRSIAEGIDRVLDDDGGTEMMVKRARARAATFTWERSARSHLAVYRDVVGR